jgi:hypothetical protein
MVGILARFGRIDRRIDRHAVEFCVRWDGIAHETPLYLTKDSGSLGLATINAPRAWGSSSHPGQHIEPVTGFTRMIQIGKRPRGGDGFDLPGAL